MGACGSKDAVVEQEGTGREITVAEVTTIDVKEAKPVEAPEQQQSSAATVEEGGADGETAVVSTSSGELYEFWGSSVRSFVRLAPNFPLRMFLSLRNVSPQIQLLRVVRSEWVLYT